MTYNFGIVKNRTCPFPVRKRVNISRNTFYAVMESSVYKMYSCDQSRIQRVKYRVDILIICFIFFSIKRFQRFTIIRFLIITDYFSRYFEIKIIINRDH